MEWVILGLLIVSVFIPSDEHSEAITVCVLANCEYSSESNHPSHTEVEAQPECEPE